MVTEALLALFVTFFFLADGDRMWGWLVRLLPGHVQGSVNGAGYRAWRVLSAWIRGSAVIATIHAVVLGTALWLLGAPLVLPLTVLVFMGGFVPVVGTLIGAVAVLVTTLTRGLGPGAISSPSCSSRTSWRRTSCSRSSSGARSGCTRWRSCSDSPRVARSVGYSARSSRCRRSRSSTRAPST